MCTKKCGLDLCPSGGGPSHMSVIWLSYAAAVSLCTAYFGWHGLMPLPIYVQCMFVALGSLHPCLRCVGTHGAPNAWTCIHMWNTKWGGETKSYVGHMWVTYRSYAPVQHILRGIYSCHYSFMSNTTTTTTSYNNYYYYFSFSHIVSIKKKSGLPARGVK